jgi:hypothetical protein
MPVKEKVMEKLPLLYRERVGVRVVSVLRIKVIKLREN